MNRNKLFFLSLLGGVVLWIATRWGIGLSHDSTVYIQGARNLQQGLGFAVLLPDGGIVPITHYPPFYSAVLALIGTIDPLHTARWLNIILFSINILLVGIFVKRCTDSWPLALACASFMLLAVDMLRIHSMAWTEPLFITLSMLGFFFLAGYLEKLDGRQLVTAGILIGLAFLLRYAGAALILTGTIAIVLMSHNKFARKIKEITIFSLFALSPFILWIIRNQYLTQRATNRHLSFHPITFTKIKQAFFTLYQWHFPQEYVSFITFQIQQLPDSLLFFKYLIILSHGLFVLGIICLIILLVSHFLLDQSRNSWKNNKYTSLLVLFIAVYSTFLIVSISFFDEKTPLDYRILSPIYVMIIILLFNLIGFYRNHSLHNLSLMSLLTRKLVAKKSEIMAKRTLKELRVVHFASLLGIFYLVVYLVSCTYWVRNNFNHGQGYASRTWKESKLIDTINQLPAGTIIYSNIADALYILTNRPNYWIPTAAHFAKEERNAAFITSLTEKMQNEEAIIIYFKKNTRGNMPLEDQIRSQLPLTLLKKNEEGSIYKIESGRINADE